MKTLGILNRPMKEKIALVCIFGAGTFAVIMSVVRLQSIYQFTLSTDPSRDGIAVSCRASKIRSLASQTSDCDTHTQVNLWSMLEVNTAILCASVPALKPIFTWKKVQDFRRPNKFPGRIDDSLNSDSLSSKKNNVFFRKPSNASLYPHLETVNLTRLSTSRSPPGSPTWKQNQSDSRPASSNRNDDGINEEDNMDSSLQRQASFHVV